MPAVPTCADSLLDLCRKSGLVEENDLRRLLKTTSLPEDPVKAAAVLVAKGLLTSFQVTQLLTGRHRGFRFGQYKILDKLGRGGTASVFLCEQIMMRRKVAVKVLPDRNAKDPGIRERFYREARAAAVLDHPNIVRTHDINSEGDLHYIAMEYVDGADLQRVLERDGPLPAGRAVNHAIQAAAGLQHAHEKGLVHRDIKPANLLLAKDGRIKVLDMGLARFFRDTKDDLTQQYDQGMVLGTVDYLAPEQAIASSNVDHRADIYSLGATLYMLTSGRTPFEGTMTQKLLMVQLRVPPTLQQVRPDVPEALSAVVAKMMAKDPADRYQSATEVIEALRPFAEYIDEQAKGSTIVSHKTVTVSAAPPAAAPPKPGADASPTLRTPITRRTKAAPAPSTRVVKAKRRAIKRWGGVALCVVGAVAVVWLVDIVKRAQTVESPQANSKWVKHQINQTEPVAPPARRGEPVAVNGGNVLCRFTAADYQPCFVRMRMDAILEKVGGDCPPGWQWGCYKNGNVVEFLVGEAAGTVGIGQRNVEGDPSAILSTTFNSRMTQLEEDRPYLVRFRYFGEEKTKALASVRRSGKITISKIDLKATDGKWESKEVPFVAPPREGLDFLVRSLTDSPNSMIFITDVELIEGARPGTEGNARH